MLRQARRALPLLLSALLVGVLGGLAVWGHLEGDRQVGSAQRADRLRVQQILTGLTEQFLQFVILDTSRAAEGESWNLRRGDAQDQAALARLARTSHLTTYGATLTTLAGERLSGYASASAPSPGDAGFAPLRRALLAGRPGVSDLVRAGDRDVVAFAVPVRREGVPVALLLVYADARTWPLQAYDRSIDLGPSAVTHVVDGRGRVVTSNDPSTLGTQLPDLPKGVTAEDRGVVTVSRAGRQEVVSWAGLDNGWMTITTQPLEAFSSGRASDSRRELALLVALVVAVMVVLLGLNHLRARALRRLAEERLHDPLTGLAQRRLFELRLDAAFARQRRSGNPLALLFCDLDAFKSVNDTYGHNVGDRYLAAVAQRLLGETRDDDLVARIGGDEFAVLLEGTDVGEAERVAQRLREAVDQPLELGGTQLRPRVSVGVAVLRDPSRADDLLAEADLAMYRVKRGDADGVVVLDAAAHEVVPQHAR
jgi:diguanylate cyclase (GGDEF)-like protein